MSDHIVVKDDKPSVIYRYTPKEPATVVDGVPARDLTEFDLAAMGASQRLAVHRIASEDGGVYAKEADLPEGLSFEPPAPPESPPPADLNAMTRADLNTYAANLGIESPESFATKGDVLAAIEAANVEKG